MAKINKLTATQEARFGEFRDDWLRIGLSTERADRPRAEAGVRLAYEAAGLKPPRLIIWLDSPMAGAMGAALLAGTEKVGKQVWAQVGAQVWDQVGDHVRDQVRDQVRAQVWDQVRAQVGAQVGAQVRDQVRDQVWDQVGAQVGDQVGAQVWAQVWDQVGAQVRAQVGAQVRDHVRDQVGDQVGAQVGAQVWAQVWDQVRDQVYRAAYGQHEAAWLAFYDFFAKAAALGVCDRLVGLMEVARSSGWWWPFEGAAILTERPTELRRNAEGRLHDDVGPAILYPDGWGIWALHGLPVDRRIVEHPELLTFSEVRDQPNTEVRRHMLDRFGGLRGSAAAGAWLQAGGLKPISEEDITSKMQPSGLSIWRLSHGAEPVVCRLYRAELPDDEPLVLIMVVCTSTAKEVFLRVPPHITDAREAREWTFGESLAEAVET